MTVRGEELPNESTTGPDLEVQETWDDLLNFSRKLGVNLVKGFGEIDRAVHAAGGPDVEEEDGTVRTIEGSWLDAMAPSTAVVSLARAPRWRRPITPVVVDRAGTRFGWTVAEVSVAKAPEHSPVTVADRAADRPTLVEFDDDDRLPIEADTGNFEVVHRVIVLGGVHRALRILSGRRDEFEGLTRLAKYKPVLAKLEDGSKVRGLPSEEDRDIIDAYARRNGFSTVSRRVITPEVIATNEMGVPDPVALADEVRAGLQELSRKYVAIYNQMNPKR